MEDTSTQTVEVDKEVKGGKLVFSFEKPTPKWATWVFRAVFLLTAAGTAIIAFEPEIPPMVKVRYLFYMKLIDFVIWGFGRGIGIKKDTFEDEQAGNVLSAK